MQWPPLCFQYFPSAYEPSGEFLGVKFSMLEGSAGCNTYEDQRLMKGDWEEQKWQDPIVAGCPLGICHHAVWSFEDIHDWYRETGNQEDLRSEYVLLYLSLNAVSYQVNIPICRCWRVRENCASWIIGSTFKFDQVSQKHTTVLYGLQEEYRKRSWIFAHVCVITQMLC